jgi:hypothetical protein
MSVFVYKGGAKSLIPPEQLQEHLINGWKVTEEAEDIDAEAGEIQTTEADTILAPAAPTKEEADTNGTGLLSNSEVRAAAEKAGIEGFKTKRIKALKVELGYEASE